MSKAIDICFSFDTTGSMSSCINIVRQNVKEIVPRLYGEIDEIRIALISHGDYCDGDNLIAIRDFTNDPQELVDFVNDKAKNTSGGDYPEAYEYVLRKVQDLSWRPMATHCLVMIGDAVPHEANENPHNYDWRVECQTLKDMNVQIYSVQALASFINSPASIFWKQLASRTDGYHLRLDQFSYIRDIIIAICMQRQSNESAEKFEQELVANSASGALTNSMRKIFDTILGRAPAATAAADEVDEVAPAAKKRKTSAGTAARVTAATETDLKTCPPAKYQVLNVPRKCSIREFVNDQGLAFKKGKGFYQYTKPETIGANKLIVLQHKVTGELYEGDAARSLAGITEEHAKKKRDPENMDIYHVFVQSTSVNRALVEDTLFLYEAEDYREEEEE